MCACELRSFPVMRTPISRTLPRLSWDLPTENDSAHRAPELLKDQSIVESMSVLLTFASLPCAVDMSRDFCYSF